MFALPPEELPPKVRAKLDAARDKLDRVGDYAARVAATKPHWENARAGVVRPIRDVLRSMCGDAEPCCYCGDSIGVTVEHIRPKALYPEQTFVWTNLLLACGRCNTIKGDRFALIINGELVDVTRPHGASVRPPRLGDIAVVDLRSEDPLALLQLELSSGMILRRPRLSSVERTRADYTRNELLRLNGDPLPDRRRQAYGNFRARVREYARRKHERGPDAAELAGLRAELCRLPHQMVWREMQRQHARIPELEDLFSEVPEALEW